MIIQIMTAIAMILMTACDPNSNGRSALTVSAQASEYMPTVIDVTVTGAQSGEIWIEYGLTELDSSTRVAQAKSGETSTITLMGLKSGSTYCFRAVNQTDGGEQLTSEIETLDIPQAPSELPEILVSIEAENPNGMILTSVIQTSQSWIVIIDQDGDYIWYYQAIEGAMVLGAVFGRDRQSVLFLEVDAGQSEDNGRIVRVSLRGEILSQTHASMGHHGFVEHEDGSMGWLFLHLQETYVEDPQITGSIELAADTIMETEEGETSASKDVPVFDFFEEYTQPEIYCGHMLMPAYNSDALDWIHSNSLVFLDDPDSYYLMSRNLDALLRISRETGEIIWQFGGAYSDFPLEGLEMWSHAHFSDIREDGVLVYDNSTHREPAYSRIVEYTWDEESLTAQRGFLYEDTRYEKAELLGDARWLPNGNYLVAWGKAGVLTEITSEGEDIWEAKLEIGFIFGRVVWTENLYAP